MIVCLRKIVSQMIVNFSISSFIVQHHVAIMCTLLESETFLIKLKIRWVYVTATIKFIRVKSELFQTIVTRPMNFRNIELVQNSVFCKFKQLCQEGLIDIKMIFPVYFRSDSFKTSFVEIGTDLNVTVKFEIVCLWVIQLF